MLIQHVLTEDIFSHVFDSADFHSQNNVAGELYKLEATFFTGTVKRNTLDSLRPYYAAIRSAAALVDSHLEKQRFLKAIYENFYRVYNPKAADRLGVVYTPNEIVRFMIEGADWLCNQHFGKGLIDRNVEILDPAAGTGTFICELIEHFRGQPTKLAHKYAEELHANEVSILPYYVANLNIEATYAATSGEYEEFQNLCFVDTLDNTAGLGIRAGHQHDMFGAMSDENVLRIKKQNSRKISLVIGNPPYNANQMSESDNNVCIKVRRIGIGRRLVAGGADDLPWTGAQVVLAPHGCKGVLQACVLDPDGREQLLRKGAAQRLQPLGIYGVALRPHGVRRSAKNCRVTATAPSAASGSRPTWCPA